MNLLIVSDPNVIPAANGASLYGNFRTRTFANIFTEFETFKEDYDNCGIPNTLSDDSLRTLYYLLYAKYGNSSIASSDETQFKYKVFSTIFMYGPAWQRRVELQHSLVSMSEEDLLKGATAIYNSALNPGDAPTTQTLEELEYINSQNTTKYKKSRLEAYAILDELIKTDVTEGFLSKFKKLFIVVVQPGLPLWYKTEGE